MEKYSVQDVFTPVHPARGGFVERGTIAQTLVSALVTAGQQIILYGHSGAGKTSLLMQSLHQLGKRSIITFCTRKAIFQELVLEAFKQLEPFYAANQLITECHLSTSLVQNDYFSLKKQINTALEQRPANQKQILDLCLHSRVLGRLMGNVRVCWVLEDINKLGDPDRYKLAQAMKYFVQISEQFSDLKIIAVGAIDSANEVTIHISEVKQKIAGIYVPPMSKVEIAAILEVGANRLNIVIPQAIKETVVNYADGLPFVCHEIGRKICYYAGIYETQDQLTVIEHSPLETILSSTPRTLI